MATFLFSLLFISNAYGQGRVLQQIGRVYIPNAGIGGAENVALAPTVNRVFAADGAQIALTVLSLQLDIENSTDVWNLQFEDTILFDTIFDDAGIVNVNASDVTSVEYSKARDLIIAAIVPQNYAEQSGFAAFIDPHTFAIFTLMELTDCFLPDHILAIDDGFFIVISCEGEANDNEIGNPLFNPPGSVTLINITNNNEAEWEMINVGFTEFDEGGSKQHLVPNDIYLPYMDKPLSVNVEPEYSTCSKDLKYCFISLQEANAIAVLDVKLAEIVSIHSLGTNDFSETGLDASDRDNMINIAIYPNLYGLRSPDAISYFVSSGGNEYIFTANEGDSKTFDESRVGDLILDNDSFNSADINVTYLQSDEQLGRLKVINQLGNDKFNANGTFTELYAFSSRDFTAFKIKRYNDTDRDNAIGMELVFSSDNDFEQYTANILGENGFNSNHNNPSFDERSDDKGPEPEGIATATCNNGKSFAFITMEQVSGIFVYDITDIDDGKVLYVEYINNRNFSVEFAENSRPPENAGDIGSEQVKFINSDVLGVPLLMVCYTESSSVTMYKIDCDYNAESDDDDLTPMQLIGIIIGSVLGVILLIAFVVYCCCKRRQNYPNYAGSAMSKLIPNDKHHYNATDDE